MERGSDQILFGESALDRAPFAKRRRDESCLFSRHQLTCLLTMIAEVARKEGDPFWLLWESLVKDAPQLQGTLKYLVTFNLIEEALEQVQPGQEEVLVSLSSAERHVAAEAVRNSARPRLKPSNDSLLAAIGVG